MKKILIAAHDPNLTIGCNGELPWDYGEYKEDMAHFKRTTMDNPILMGRGVFEELGEKPLPGRRNMVLTTTQVYDNVEYFRKMNRVFELLDGDGEEQVFIIGGQQVYNQTLSTADELIITEIEKEYAGDTYFPEYRDLIGIVWEETSRDRRDGFSIVRYSRINNYHYRSINRL